MNCSTAFILREFESLEKLINAWKKWKYNEELTVDNIHSVSSYSNEKFSIYAQSTPDENHNSESIWKVLSSKGWKKISFPNQTLYLTPDVNISSIDESDVDNINIFKNIMLAYKHYLFVQEKGHVAANSDTIKKDLSSIDELNRKVNNESKNTNFDPQTSNQNQLNKTSKAKKSIYPKSQLYKIFELSDDIEMNDYNCELFLRDTTNVLIKKLSKEWIGRKNQLQNLQELCSGYENDNTDHILVLGDSNTGKTSIVHAFLKHSEEDFVYVNSTICYSLHDILDAIFIKLVSITEEAIQNDKIDTQDHPKNNEPRDNEHEDFCINNIKENALVLEELFNSQSNQIISSTQRKYINHFQPKRQNKKNDKTKTKYFYNISNFAYQLQYFLNKRSKSTKLLKKNRAFFIVLDNVDIFFQRFPLLLNILLDFNNQNLDIIEDCVYLRLIMICNNVPISLENQLQSFGNIHPIFFETYNLEQCKQILENTLSKYVEKNLAESFANYVTKIFYQVVCDINELQRIAFDLYAFWRKCCPNEVQLNDSSYEILEKRVQLTKQRLFLHDFQDDFSFSTINIEHSEPCEFYDNTDIPYNSKIMLIAAFITSFNSEEYNRQMFGSDTRKSTKQKIHKGKKKGGAAKINISNEKLYLPQTQIGPRKFPIERVLWIYKALLTSLHDFDAAKKSFNEDMYKHLSRLIDMGMLARVSAYDRPLNTHMFKCIAPFQYVNAVSNTIVGFSLLESLECKTIN